MLVLSAEKIKQSLPDKILLDDISLFLNERDKVGLIGINGTGKSTFMKILSGSLQPDSGNITYANPIRIGYLPQNPDFSGERSILEQVFYGADASIKEQKDYEAKSILGKLGIYDTEQSIQNLSGGQKKRIALASVFIQPCDLLLLDEPTNHLDSDMILWLESTLQRFTGAIFMVTHDRYFLDRIVNRIVELEEGHLFSYPGNYSQYLQLKEERISMEQASQRKKKSLLIKELAWMQRGVKARGTKSKSRIEQFHSLQNSIQNEETSQMQVTALSQRLGKKTIQLQHISKSFQNQTLIDDFSYTIERDARIGILGPNGCGKSTLLKLILGQIPPDHGEIIIGETVKFGYFSQENTEMDLSQKVIDIIKEGGESIATQTGRISAASLAEQFLFPPHLQYLPASKLSGGERRRLALCRILMTAPNILLFDEPTNDLDIETLTILENYLESFPGAVVSVSHDRYFLDKIANTILCFTGNGQIQPFLGGYQDAMTALKEQQKLTEKQEKQTVKTMPDKAEKPKKLKLTFKEEKEYATIEEDIAQLETHLQKLEESMLACATDFIKLQELAAQKEETNQQLAYKMERWLYLSELVEKIDQEKQKEKRD